MEHEFAAAGCLVGHGDTKRERRVGKSDEIPWPAPRLGSHQRTHPSAPEPLLLRVTVGNSNCRLPNQCSLCVRGPVALRPTAANAQTHEGMYLTEQISQAGGYTWPAAAGARRRRGWSACATSPCTGGIIGNWNSATTMPSAMARFQVGGRRRGSEGSHRGESLTAAGERRSKRLRAAFAGCSLAPRGRGLQWWWCHISGVGPTNWWSAVTEELLRLCGHGTSAQSSKPVIPALRVTRLGQQFQRDVAVGRAGGVPRA